MKAPEGLKREKCNKNAEVAATPTEKRSDSMEKVDVSPENNTKKDTPPEINGRMTTSASAILADHKVQYSEIPKSLSLFEVCTQVPPVSPKHSMAFTIDFGGPADEQRYRNMYEKFQNRHRRGTSLTKFDDVPPPRTKIPMSAKLPRKQIPVPMRDKNRLQAQDASKRHSWSPRSSIATPDIRTKFTPRSLTLTKVLKGNKNDEITCPAPPLIDPQSMGEDQVSDAGTYTLDADNYTEEQKERMNIDLSDDMEELKIREGPKRPNFFQTNLETFDNDLSQRYQESDCPYDGKSVRKNILEISCSHETSTAKPKVSYLERLKNRVKNISDRTFHKSRSPDKLLPSPDVGTFTSVTTSGILSVKHTLENNPRLTRRNSLTKSQIDNSEYVQGVSRLNVNSSDERSVRSPNRSNEISSGATSIKSAVTKNDWIQEWARHARQHSAQKSRSFESPTEDLSSFPDTMSRSAYDEGGYMEGSFMRSQLRSSIQGRIEGTYNDVSERRRLEKRPPLSPTKIPSPVGSLQKRPRSRSSSTRSLQGSLTDDTDVYLQKTAAAITTLQKIHRHSLQNSPKSPNVSSVVPTEEYLLMQLTRMQKYHKRNHSLDGIEAHVKEFRRHHTRHHSYESNDKHPPRCDNTLLYADRQSFIDTDCASDVARKSLIKQTVNALPQKGSPIRRSTSFNSKTPNQTGTPKMPCKTPQRLQSIQKSASSNNFRTVIATYGDDDIMEFIINDNVDLDAEQFASDSDTNEPQKTISNTRYNKAFLMRMEQNRRPAAKQGMVACPNTPEMRRREPNVRQSLRERMSMPRDSSLNRMKQDLARRQQSKEQTPKVQPRYMDISKYKPVTGANFLKKDESKSYLLHKEVKKSPSSASVNLSRGDASRVSNRSIKSAGMRPSSGKKESPAPQKQTKEAELAMWKRRASYDPMKAALEGKRKQDEAKRLAQQQQSKFGESSSAVLRSQSFHSGVSSQTKTTQMAKTTIQNQWTAHSESSDDNES
uniref:Uncharacterized protein n=1 Tax=Nyssomyia neivai TaxID=330878 RepID=A0A1L8DCP7_9DIPT